MNDERELAMTDLTICQRTQDAIALDGDVPRDDALAAHVGRCDACSSFLERALLVEGELGSLDTADVSDEVVERLLARPELKRPSHPPRSMQWALGLAAAAVIGFVALNITLSTDLNQAPAAARPAPAPAKEKLEQEDLDALRSLGYVSGDSVSEPSFEESELRDEKKARDLQKQDAPKRQGKDSGVEGGEAGGRVQALTAPIEKAIVPAEPEPIEADDLESFSSVGEELNRANSPAINEGIAGGIVGGFTEGAASDGRYRQDAVPGKRVDVEPEYPEAARRARVSGIVTLRVNVDSDGNVTDAIVIQSVPLLDDAARDAVLQWKYQASETVLRQFIVDVTFALEDQDDSSAGVFSRERRRIDGLTFQSPTGYWANTYLPGDPKARLLETRLARAGIAVAPHALALPTRQPFDAPFRGALGLSIGADRHALAGPSRVLVQIGLQGTPGYGRRRPPMNIGIVSDVNREDSAAVRALLEALQDAKQVGDRFRLIVPGSSNVIAPDAFRHGPLSVAIDNAPETGSRVEALARALELVHADDDPAKPLGTSLVLFVTGKELGGELPRLSELAHRSALGGVPVSVVGIGDRVDARALDRLALDGQGRRYVVERTSEAGAVVERELQAAGRAVARAIRLRIKLAEGVRLVDVIGSRSLSQTQTKRVRDAEKSIDLRLAKNLGIEADRGDDEDGIQIVIPSFYAGDAHVILLDVVADRPGAVASVTARFKDLTLLRNTTTSATLSLPRGAMDSAVSPLQQHVVASYLAARIAAQLDVSGDRLSRNDLAGAIDELRGVVALLDASSLRDDVLIARDRHMVQSYISILSSSPEPQLLPYFADSLRMAAIHKRSSMSTS